MTTTASHAITPVKWKPVVSIIISTLVLVVSQYQDFFSDSLYDGLLLFLAIPLLIIHLVFRGSPARYGVQIGDWKKGLTYTAIGCLAAAGILWIAIRLPGIEEYYAPQAQSKLPYPLRNAIDLLDWEFFFRGFLIFSLAEISGPYAILLQAVPFTLAHYGKPFIETSSCIFGGAAFGWVAWKTRSFLYPFLIHLFLSTYVVYLASR
jgi:membrane protease YdiL (CAAX protease family)